MSATIAIAVVNAAGEPIEGAYVDPLEGPEGAGLTGADGVAKIPKPKNGNDYLQVTAEGYGSYSAPQKWQAVKSLRIVLTPPPWLA